MLSTGLALHPVGNGAFGRDAAAAKPVAAAAMVVGSCGLGFLLWKWASGAVDGYFAQLTSTLVVVAVDEAALAVACHDEYEAGLGNGEKDVAQGCFLSFSHGRYRGMFVWRKLLRCAIEMGLFDVAGMEKHDREPPKHCLLLHGRVPSQSHLSLCFLLPQTLAYKEQFPSCNLVDAFSQTKALHSVKSQSHTQVASLMFVMFLPIHIHPEHPSHNPTMPSGTNRSTSPKRQNLSSTLSPFLHLLKQRALLKSNNITALQQPCLDIRRQSPQSHRIDLSADSIAVCPRYRDKLRARILLLLIDRHTIKQRRMRFHGGHVDVQTKP